MLREGWYLMSVPALERELIRWRTGEGPPGEGIEELSVEEALAFRNRGNVPDGSGRSLRLVLHVFSEEDLRNLDAKRLRFEPDHLDAPTWRVEGSVPVNVVPLRSPEVKGSGDAWWEDDAVAALEEEWRAGGTLAGVPVPQSHRGLLIKSVLALRAAGKPVDAAALCDAVARWLTPAQVEEVRRALTREAVRRATDA